MILNFFSAIWAATAPALGNHLWQSTLCVIIAGLLTLVLRKNSARTRYGIWLAASIKFLLPFSLLIAIGTHWARPRPAAASQPGLFYAMEQASQPFTPAAQAEQSRRPAQDTGVRYTLAHLLPAIFVAAWFCGFVAVVLVWYARWRRIAATVRDAAPLSEGREVEALRSVERRAGIRKPIDLRVSRGSLEPGIFGISRPVLVWPEAISERLDDAQLKAILAHEVWHVRRRDNLAAAIHMVVEALFWFHPLVWWLTARLVEERERACDEAVLKVGSERQVYAESILKTCEFCLESPLACVSGVTGADLKRRIVRIMTQSILIPLSLSRKLLLAAVAIAVIAVPVLSGLASAARHNAQSEQSASTLSYDVVSIKPCKTLRQQRGGRMMPDGLIFMSIPLSTVIAGAYDVRMDRVSGMPGWLTSDPYDLQVKMGDETLAAFQKLSEKDQRRERFRMLQPVLEDRLKLKVHRETKLARTYALVIAKGGCKLKEADPNNSYENGIKVPEGVPRAGAMSLQGGKLLVQAITMSRFAIQLGGLVDGPVEDKTGLMGKYDFTLEWTPSTSGAASEDGGPSIFTALQEQLGLKLEPAKGQVEVLVIDHIERPSEN